MFKISVKKTFRAWHGLKNYRGGNEKPHEHDWLCEVTFETKRLDESGCAMDFHKVDDGLSRVIAKISGTELLEKNLLKGMSPSTENIAKYIYEEMDKIYKGPDVKLASVKLFEDPNHSATYYE